MLIDSCLSLEAVVISVVSLMLAFVVTSVHKVVLFFLLLHHISLRSLDICSLRSGLVYFGGLLLLLDLGDALILVLLNMIALYALLRTFDVSILQIVSAVHTGVGSVEFIVRRLIVAQLAS